MDRLEFSKAYHTITYVLRRRVSRKGWLASGKVSSFTYYPRTSPPVNITEGSTYNHVINFSKGQSVSGSLIAH